MALALRIQGDSWQSTQQDRAMSSNGKKFLTRLARINLFSNVSHSVDSFLVARKLKWSLNIPQTLSESMNPNGFSKFQQRILFSIFLLLVE